MTSSKTRATVHWHRRRWLAAAAAGTLAGLAAGARATAAGAAPRVEVWKNPSCGCCGDWIAHLQAQGFQVKVNEVPDTAPVRARLGIAPQHGSCHTALVGGYALEGHVPAREIRRLLKERPEAVGLAVPGMPIGSPGMDGPEYKGQKQAYDVLLLAKGGGASVYARYR